MSFRAGWDFGTDKICYTCQDSYMAPPGGQLGNLGWTAQILWTHYRYTGNETMLRTLVYPLLRMSNNYYTRFGTKGGVRTRLAFLRNGTYHLPKAQSPEYGECEDTNYDLALFRWGVKTMDEVLRLLNRTDVNQQRWHEVIDHLTDYPADEDGLLVGAGLKLTSMHRHWSHLFALYPLHVSVGVGGED